MIFIDRPMIGRLMIGLMLCSGGILAQPQVNTNSSEALVLYKQSLDKSPPFQTIIQSGENAVKAAVREEDYNLISLSHTQLGMLYWLDGQFVKAIQHLNKGQEQSIKLKDSINWARCTHYKGLVYYYQCRFDSALLLYGLAENVYKQQGIDSAQAKVKSHKGLIYSATGKYKLAAQNMIESYSLREAQPSYRDMSIRIEFSFEAAEQLFYQSKLDQDLESLRFTENKNDPDKLAYALLNVGLDYYFLRQYATALKYFKKSSKVYRSLNQPSSEVDMARSYEGLGLYDSAVLSYKKGIEECKERDTQIHLAAAYSNLAKCYRVQKKWDEALHYYVFATALNSKMGTRRSESGNHIAMALIFCETKEWKKALDQVNISLAISNAIGCVKDVHDALEIKARILWALQKDKEAYIVLSQSLAVQDSIIEGESQLQIVQLQIEYETEKKKRELSELQIQNKLKEIEIESRKLQIALAFSLLSVIAIAGGWYFYRYRQKKKLSDLLSGQNKIIELQNEGLEKRNREKEILLSETHHRVKNNLQIVSSLVNLRAIKTNDGIIKEFLVDLSNRVQVMGLVHDMLYRLDNIEIVNMTEYLRELTKKITSSLAEHTPETEFSYVDSSVELVLDTALSLGLIHNELLTNSIKYAKSSGSLKIICGLRTDSISNRHVYFFKDNGVNSISVVPSFGLRFVKQIAEQKLRGELCIITEKGFSAEIHFPI